MIRRQDDSSKPLTPSFYSGSLLTLGVSLFIVLGLAPAALVRAQAPAVSSDQVEHRKTSKPYSGDLSTFESKDRAKKLHVERVMDILGISSGKAVADIGAGSGWFSVRAAERVTPTGMVYAIDINPKAISYIQERVRRDSIPNVHTVLSKPDDPLLPTKHRCRPAPEDVPRSSGAGCAAEELAQGAPAKGAGRHHRSQRQWRKSRCGSRYGSARGRAIGIHLDRRIRFCEI